MFSSCLRCGRKLTHPASAKRGYGSSCFKKVETAKKKDKETEENIDVNFVDELKQKVS